MSLRLKKVKCLPKVTQVRRWHFDLESYFSLSLLSAS
jgi:hypothetical protein